MNEPTTLSTSEPTHEQTALLMAKVRRLMAIGALTIAIGIGAIFIVIGYRLFRGDTGSSFIDATATLPSDARVIASAVSGDRLLLTLDVGGATEIRSFDARTLKPVGRLRLSREP